MIEAVKFIRNRVVLRAGPFFCTLAVVVFIASATVPLQAVAGGGPETTLVVVNGDSPNSLYIANFYVRLREIPPNHVVWLRDIRSLYQIDIDTFRNRIWKPILEHIESNNLQAEIDTIVYSADFPYSVDISSDVKKNKLTKRRGLGRGASLTALTYFARRVEKEDAGYLGVNKYFRRDLSPQVRLSRKPTETEIKQLKNAGKAMKKKNYREAVEIYRKFVRSYPWGSHAWHGLASGLAELGQTDEAMHALTRAVDMGWAHGLSVRTDKHLKRLEGHPGFESLIKRMQTMKGKFQSARGFRSHYIWTGDNEPIIYRVLESLDSYYLSTLLAYTGQLGNSIPEVLSYLGSSVGSDGSFPDGTVYLMENSNVRSTTRERYFHATVEALKDRGRNALILSKWQRGQNGRIPYGKDDVIGAVVGTQSFDWNNSESRLLPGAIAESLTSYGGHFNKAKQTKLTEFLRNGAAGSSGTVVEPLAIQAKFPVSYMHVHYADGSSLAEAFYQSVATPYQLIIVGDALARPFAHFARVRLLAPDPEKSWKGVVLLKPHVRAAKGRAVRRVELWVDGQNVADAPAGEDIVWDTSSVEDGSHDLRLVAVEDTPIETRSYVRMQVLVSNTGTRVDIDKINNPVILGDDIVISGTADSALSVQIFQGVRPLGSAKVQNGRWSINIPSVLPGYGDVSLYVKGKFQDGSVYRSIPVEIHIEVPRLLKAGNRINLLSKQGLNASVNYKSGSKQDVIINKLKGPLEDLGKDKRNITSINIEGEFNVGKTGFYQLAVNARGQVNIEVDDLVSLDAELHKNNGDRFLPLNLESGWHKIKITLVPKRLPYIRLVLSGEQVAKVLAGDMLRHRESP